MARHLSLPPRSSPPKPAVVAPAPAVTSETQDIKQFLADRVTSVAENGQFVYMLQARLKGGTMTSILFLAHKNQYDLRVFGDMVKEAVAVVNGTRIPHRRAQMAKEKTPINDATKINETLFEGDADVLQVVMCDKFGFRKLFYTPMETEIIPTVVR